MHVNMHYTRSLKNSSKKRTQTKIRIRTSLNSTKTLNSQALTQTLSLGIANILMAIVTIATKRVIKLKTAASICMT